MLSILGGLHCPRLGRFWRRAAVASLCNGIYLIAWPCRRITRTGIVCSGRLSICPYCCNDPFSRVFYPRNSLLRLTKSLYHYLVSALDPSRSPGGPSDLRRPAIAIGATSCTCTLHLSNRQETCRVSCTEGRQARLRTRSDVQEETSPKKGENFRRTEMSMVKAYLSKSITRGVSAIVIGVVGADLLTGRIIILLLSTVSGMPMLE